MTQCGWAWRRPGAVGAARAGRGPGSALQDVESHRRGSSADLSPAHSEEAEIASKVKVLQWQGPAWTL